MLAVVQDSQIVILKPINMLESKSMPEEGNNAETAKMLMEDSAANVENNEDQRSLSFGEIIVGLDFNPGGNPKVTRLKQLAAEMIDIVSEDDASNPISRTKSKIADDAIGEILTAQMWAVKAVTFKY